MYIFADAGAAPIWTEVGAAAARFFSPSQTNNYTQTNHHTGYIANSQDEHFCNVVFTFCVCQSLCTTSDSLIYSGVRVSKNHSHSLARKVVKSLFVKILRKNPRVLAVRHQLKGDRFCSKTAYVL